MTMIFKNKILNNVLWILLFGIAITACKKLDRPVLGDYPKDVNPPGGSLKFYAALDGSIVDSTKANYGLGNNVSFGTGVSGKAVQFDGSKNGYVSFPSANDFGSS